MMFWKGCGIKPPQFFFQATFKAFAWVIDRRMSRMVVSERFELGSLRTLSINNNYCTGIIVLNTLKKYMAVASNV